MRKLLLSLLIIGLFTCTFADRRSYLYSDSDVKMDGRLILNAARTFTDSDTTPNVGKYTNWETGTTTATITDFDGTDIEEGQVLVVISKGAITYDVTTSGIKGGTTDIVTAAADVTLFMYDGADWYVIGRIDQSDDLN